MSGRRLSQKERIALVGGATVSADGNNPPSHALMAQREPLLPGQEHKAPPYSFVLLKTLEMQIHGLDPGGIPSVRTLDTEYNDLRRIRTITSGHTGSTNRRGCTTWQRGVS